MLLCFHYDKLFRAILNILCYYSAVIYLYKCLGLSMASTLLAPQPRYQQCSILFHVHCFFCFQGKHTNFHLLKLTYLAVNIIPTCLILLHMMQIFTHLLLCSIYLLILSLFHRKMPTVLHGIDLSEVLYPSVAHFLYDALDT